MKAVVNGEEWELPEGATVADILQRLNAPETGIAVARQGEVIPKTSWQATPIQNGDEIEVLTAAQGG